MTMGADPYRGPETAADLSDEIARLKTRIAELEAERDDYAQQVEELFVLQQVFSTINSTLQVDDILSMVLRGVAEALRFRRVILFDVLENGAIVRRIECDGEGRVFRSADEYEYRVDSVLGELSRGLRQLAFGSANDGDKPLEDTRSFYCVAPLVVRDVVRGLLYADDPPKGIMGENQIRTLFDFAAQAAIAMDNARLKEESRRLLEETQRLALTDSLTGLLNRRALNEMLEHELATAERYQTPLAFVILDLDDLKQINDSGGHNRGDDELKRFAKLLKQNARRGDIVARFAGDEFVIVMLHTNRPQAAKGVERFQGELTHAAIRASIGVAMYPHDGHDVQSLFLAADQALYEAKHSGKNCARFYGRGDEMTLDAAN